MPNGIRPAYRPGPFTLLLLLSAILSPGCATMIHGTTQEIGLVAQPEGTVVVVNGVDQFDTPANIEAPRRDDLYLAFHHPGYQSEYRRITSSLAPEIGLNIFHLYGAPVTIAADMILGGGYQFDQKVVHVSLEPNPKTPLISEAEEPPTQEAEYVPLPTMEAMSLEPSRNAWFRSRWVKDAFYPVLGASVGLAVGGVGAYFSKKEREHQCLSHASDGVLPPEIDRRAFCKSLTNSDPDIRYNQRVWFSVGTAVGLTAGFAVLQGMRDDWDTSLPLPVATAALAGAGAVAAGLYYWNPRSNNDLELAIEATAAPLVGYLVGRLLNRWLDLEIEAAPIVDETSGEMTGAQLGWRAEF